MMTTITARTHDQPMTSDGATIFATLPAGLYEFRSAADGGVLVVATVDTASKQPTRAQIEDDNAAGLKRVVAAAGGVR